MKTTTKPKASSKATTKAAPRAARQTTASRKRAQTSDDHSQPATQPQAKARHTSDSITDGNPVVGDPAGNTRFAVGELVDLPKLGGATGRVLAEADNRETYEVQMLWPGRGERMGIRGGIVETVAGSDLKKAEPIAA
jgi:hypothetical protein